MSMVSRTVFVGDNLPVLRGMEAGSVDMVYADPPFNSNRNYAAPIGSKAAGAMFRDTWTLNDVDVAWSGEILGMMPSVSATIEIGHHRNGGNVGGRRNAIVPNDDGGTVD